nr:putative reverse transcriptase domain-containing protein [Tanacetum cinerariifolium]
MSDSDESGVTYTDISSPFEEFSDIGSPRADDHEHLMLCEMLEDPYVEVALQAPPSPDYIPGLEEPEQAPPSPDYVPGLEHTDDEIVTEDQPYAEDASPIAQSPEYVPEYDFKAHPEDDDDEDPKEDPINYPADGGDNGNDEEENPVEIMDREVKRLKQSRIPIVKVRWNSWRGPEFTWEHEDFFKSKYPHLFARRHVTRQGKRRDVAS